MTHTNLVLGSNWPSSEWPDYVDVEHDDGRDRGAVRYAPERTCAMVYDPGWSDDELYPTEAYSCSECGHIDLDGKPRYCRYCGARVEEGR